LLSDRAITWWETVQLRRATETLTWNDFKSKFENQFYSRYHRKVKEQEFLALRQDNMSVLEYERRFHDLLLFAPHCVPTEEYMIEKLRDGFQQELKQGLIVVRFKSVRELIEATQALELVLEKANKGITKQGKKEKGKSGVFKASKKRGTITVLYHHQLSGRVMSRQTHPRANP